jgi:hypothetical protein
MRIAGAAASSSTRHLDQEISTCASKTLKQGVFLHGVTCGWRESSAIGDKAKTKNYCDVSQTFRD